jgi:epoxide hydrolase-like predicted phosphatase
MSEGRSTQSDSIDGREGSASDERPVERQARRAQSETIDAVLFDFSGVLTTSPWANIAATAGGDLELLVGPYHEDGDHPWHRLERGEIDFREWFAEVSELAADAGIELDLAPMAALREALTVHPHVVERVLELRRDGFKTALITNNVREGAAFWRELVPLDDLFDVVIDSSEVGLRKPNPAIYALTLERLGGIEPHRAVFLDDVESNVAGARRAGLHGIVVGEPPDGALEELDRLLEAQSARSE